jgi:hypothetical protein
MPCHSSLVLFSRPTQAYPIVNFTTHDLSSVNEALPYHFLEMQLLQTAYRNNTGLIGIFMYRDAGFEPNLHALITELQPATCYSPQPGNITEAFRVEYRTDASLSIA